MFTVTPQQAYAEVVHCVSRRKTPLLLSSPGMGKSSIMHQIAKDYRLKLIDLRLSQCMPEDLNGYPMRQGNKATFTPFDVFPIEGDTLPVDEDGVEMEGWLLFLDELTSATKPVQAAAYKLILDRMVGSFHLHEKVAIVAAGNKISDKAVVQQMSTALQSRVIHYEMDVSPKEWSDYAFKVGLDHRVIGFISFQPAKLMDFRPDHQDKTFPCPRTWEFLSDLIKGDDVSPDIGPRIAGTIGQGAAVEFITFAQEFDRLPKFDDIVAKPTQTKIPDEPSTKYATVAMVVENLDKSTIDPVIEYMSRFNIEIQIIFARALIARHADIRANVGSQDAFSRYLTKMVRYLQ